MPFINVKTNVSVSKDKETAVKAALGKTISDIPGKSEGWLMVGFEPGSPLYFKGSDEPAAMVQVSVYGNPSAAAMNTLTAHITEIMQGDLGISSDRVYVSYALTENWGWNGSNF